MKFIEPIALTLATALLLDQAYRLLRSRPTDGLAIDNLLHGLGLRKVEVKRTYNYWRYWIRGWLTVSNCARIYIVTAEQFQGSRRQIHVAFDDWGQGSGDLQILLERQVPALRS